MLLGLGLYESLHFLACSPDEFSGCPVFHAVVEKPSLTMPYAAIARTSWSSGLRHRAAVPLRLLNYPLSAASASELDPPLEGALHGGVVGEFLGHPVPLAARPEPEDDGF